MPNSFLRSSAFAGPTPFKNSIGVFNIESLIVAPTEDPTVSRMTVVTSGSDAIIEQMDFYLFLFQ